MNTPTKLQDRTDISQAMKQWYMEWHPYELKEQAGWILERVDPDGKLHHLWPDTYPRPAVYTEEAARALCDRLNKEAV